MINKISSADIFDHTKLADKINELVQAQNESTNLLYQIDEEITQILETFDTEPEFDA